MPGTTFQPVTRLEKNSEARLLRDALAVEEPLEIRLLGRAISITMRTPGEQASEDDELALGFLFSEGILRDRSQLLKVEHCGSSNTIKVELKPEAESDLDLKRLERHFYTSSSCGVCGKTSIEALRVQRPWELRPAEPKIDTAILHSLPEKLLSAQERFQSTGGLHASALFDLNGNLLVLREDVGRHNALDKVLGWAFLQDKLPLNHCILLVSGRASFELLQKAAMGGIPILAAIGAPSSLAVELAKETGLTLLGFLRADRMNVYSSPERIQGPGD